MTRPSHEQLLAGLERVPPWDSDLAHRDRLSDARAELIHPDLNNLPPLADMPDGWVNHVD